MLDCLILLISDGALIWVLGYIAFKRAFHYCVGRLYVTIYV